MFQRIVLAGRFGIVFRNIVIQVGRNFVGIEVGALHGFFQRDPAAAAVIQVQFIEKGNRLGIIPYHFRQSIFCSNHGAFLP